MASIIWKGNRDYVQWTNLEAGRFITKVLCPIWRYGYWNCCDPDAKRGQNKPHSNVCNQKIASDGEKECLSVTFTFDKFRRYLKGKEFVIESDHWPMQVLNEVNTSNPRIMRWGLIPVSIEICHWQGECDGRFSESPSTTIYLSYWLAKLWNDSIKCMIIICGMQSHVGRLIVC